jgi:excisionase family DNA binding protein
MLDRLLTTAEAAERLGTSARTLEDWRQRGGGPLFRKVGRRLVRYAPADLEAFTMNGARSNTGDLRA